MYKYIVTIYWLKYDEIWFLHWLKYDKICFLYWLKYDKNWQIYSNNVLTKILQNLFFIFTKIWQKLTNVL